MSSCLASSSTLSPLRTTTREFSGRSRALGEKFDFLIGACDSRQWLDRCNFLPLGVYRHCVAVPREHPLARKTKLTIQDLYGQTLMMVKRGDSPTVDRVRDYVEKHPAIAIEDTPQFYDMEVFNRCVQTRNPLMSLECWGEVHPALVTLPVDWPFTIPYGILYPLHPDPDTLRVPLPGPAGDGGERRTSPREKLRRLDKLGLSCYFVCTIVLILLPKRRNLP